MKITKWKSYFRDYAIMLVRKNRFEEDFFKREPISFYCALDVSISLYSGQFIPEYPAWSISQDMSMLEKGVFFTFFTRYDNTYYWYHVNRESRTIALMKEEPGDYNPRILLIQKDLSQTKMITLSHNIQINLEDYIMGELL